MIQYLWIGLAIIVGLIALNQSSIADHFPIHTIKVYGIQHADKHRIEETLNSLSHSNFFNVRLDDLRDHLSQQPWISEVAIRRVWPDQVEVVVVEHTPVGRWGKNTLLSQSGVLFTPIPAFPVEAAALPLFEGPPGQQMVMLAYFNKMNQLLTPLHVKMTHLVLSPYQNWQLQLDNGVTLQMGHKDVLTRLGHFVKVYPKIVGNNAALLESVDLRYPNGVAVRWKSNYGKEASK
jgi:cell division protein FtsQ